MDSRIGRRKAGLGAAGHRDPARRVRSGSGAPLGLDYAVVSDPYTETRPDGAERRAREVVRHDLALGGHPAAEANRDPDADRLDDGDAHDMVVGMEWLSRFEAFGWELAPFRLYFVPGAAPE